MNLKCDLIYLLQATGNSPGMVQPRPIHLHGGVLLATIDSGVNSKLVAVIRGYVLADHGAPPLQAARVRHGGLRGRAVRQTAGTLFNGFSKFGKIPRKISQLHYLSKDPRSWKLRKIAPT